MSTDYEQNLSKSVSMAENLGIKSGALCMQIVRVRLSQCSRSSKISCASDAPKMLQKLNIQEPSPLIIGNYLQTRASQP